MAQTESKLKARHILVAGSDTFAVKERGKVLVQQLAPDDPMSLDTVDGQAESVDHAARQIESVVEALLTLPFLGGFKLVYFKNCNFLGDSVMGRSEVVTSRLARLAEVLGKMPPDQVRLLLTAVELDRRKAFFKAFEKTGMVELFDLPDIKGERAERAWVMEIGRQMTAAGLKPAPGVVERLFEMVGNDRGALGSEIEKLSLYAYPKGDVSEDDLKLVVAGGRERLIWDLLDAVLAGESSEALSVMRQLLMQDRSMSEVGILIMLSGQVRLAALGVHLLESRKMSLRRNGTFLNAELTAEGEAFLPVNKKGEKASVFRLARVVELAKRRPATSWFEGLNILQKTHVQLVSSVSDREKLLEAAILRICRL